MGDVKMGRWRWEVVSSRIVPIQCYGEDSEQDMGDLWKRVRFTRMGWLEQVWERKTQSWREEKELVKEE